MSEYKKGAENIPIRNVNTELKALVIVYNLKSTKEEDDVVQERQINYGDPEDRKWLGRITFWALTNHHSVETINMADADLPERQPE